MSMRNCLLGLSACSLALVSSGACAAGLLDAYQAARQNDPAFQAARFERDAGQYAIDIGLAGLLPTVSITGSYAKNTGERESTLVDVTQDLDYYDKQAALTLRQPLFNYESYVRYRQGGVQADGGLAHGSISSRASRPSSVRARKRARSKRGSISATRSASRR